MNASRGLAVVGVLLMAIIVSGCMVSERAIRDPSQQLAFVYLGEAQGNYIIYPNEPRYQRIKIYRKVDSDSTYQYAASLKRNLLRLRYRVGNNGPGYMFHWVDGRDSSVDTRYAITALDSDGNPLSELRLIYSISDGNGGRTIVRE
jgi:hypothetical protein